MNASPKNLPAPPPQGAPPSKGDDPDSHTMPLMEHLMELRKRLIYSIATLIVAFLISATFASRVYAFLARPVLTAMAKVGGGNHMIYTHLAEGFMTYMKVAFFTAAFVTFPVFANQIWKFVAPGLYKHEKKAILPFLWAAPILFFMGGALAYYVILPAASTFLLGFQQLGSDATVPIEADLKISEYLAIVMQLIFAFGIAFQMPVLLVLLVRVGIISAQALANKRRYAIILIFVFAAVVTPPDVVSQLSLAIPMLILYEASVLAARMVEKKKADTTEAEEAAASDGADDTDFNES